MARFLCHGSVFALGTRQVLGVPFTLVTPCSQPAATQAARQRVA